MFDLYQVVHSTSRANLVVVKVFRLIIIALLAVLLPLRGATAAVLVCEEVPSGAAVAEHSMHEGGQADEMDVDCGHAHEASSDQAHDGLTHVLKCGVSCSVTPLASVEPALVGSVATATVSFPTYAASAPSFISDGQDRPPRTI